MKQQFSTSQRRGIGLANTVWLAFQEVSLKTPHNENVKGNQVSKSVVRVLTLIERELKDQKITFR